MNGGLRMGFFSELKDDLSQAVNELMPEEAAEQTPDDNASDDGVEKEEDNSSIESQNDKKDNDKK